MSCGLLKNGFLPIFRFLLASGHDLHIPYTDEDGRSAERKPEYKALLCWYTSSVYEITGAKDYSDQVSNPLRLTRM